jgi:DNA-binding beta-propeller fold protein YncE
VLVSCAKSGEVALFDRATRKELRRSRIGLEAAPEAVARLFGDRFGSSPVPVGLVVSPDEPRAWIAATQSDVVVALDSETLEVRGLIPTGREPDGMAYTPVAVEAQPAPAPGS